MYLRLAFATAVHANPDILLIDEVFAVGDEAFKIKCTEKMEELQRQGKTVVFVSHDLDAVSQLCQRSMLLYDGRITSIGSTESVIRDYQAVLQGNSGDA